MQEETNSQYRSQTSVTLLAQKGREQGFLTFNQIADALPSSIDPEQLGDIVQLMESIGIRVCEDSEVEDEQLLYDTGVVASSNTTEEIQQVVPESGHTTARWALCPSSPGARRSTSRSASRKGHTWSKARSLATLRQSTTS